MVCGLFYIYLTLNKFSLCPLNELVVFFTSDPTFLSNVAFGCAPINLHSCAISSFKYSNRF